MTIETLALPEYGAILWLDGDDEEGLKIWLQAWESTRARRPHDHPAYLRMMCPGGYVPMAAFYRHAPGINIIYPFHARDLTELSFCPPDSGPLLHLGVCRAFIATQHNSYVKNITT